MSARKESAPAVPLAESVRGLLMVAPPILLIIVFVGLPIVNAVLYSLGHTGGLNEITALTAQHQFEATAWWGTTDAYADVLGSPRFQQDLLLTIGVTVISTVVVLVLATGIALYLRLQPNWLSKALAAFCVVPMFIPVVIGAWAILSFYSGTGWVRSVFAQIGVEAPIWGFTPVAVVIGSVWTSLPFATLMIASGVQAVPDALIDASRDAGASLARTVWSVVLPLASVPMVIAGTFTAIGIIGSFTVPYFTGPNAPAMLGVDLANYFQAFNQPQQAIVMAVVVFGLASAIGAIYVWANFRGSREVAR